MKPKAGIPFQFGISLCAALLLLAIAAPAALADPVPDPAMARLSPLSSLGGFFGDWFAMASRAQAEQPHWITPLVTVTPRLEQELRYDQFFQSSSEGNVATDSFDGGKGLEIIPEGHTEVIVGMPPFLKRTRPRNTDGFGDWPFLLKLRLLSANEDSGNYIVTAFMGFSVPTGSNVNGSGHGIFTPTLAFGKGFGDFDVQSTVGVALPSGGLDRLGLPVAYNTTFQYRVFKYLWPEFETNYTWFSYGKKTGHNQLFLTPGIVMGRFPIHDRIGVTLGTGVQIAATKYRSYNHNWIITARIPF
ncbi:MAG TPA: hypothetical protein VEC38_02610 [Candidatus Binataceae bacterium]|nr:hypothetical protein [Candidatus Binataceae bacterium]